MGRRKIYTAEEAKLVKSYRNKIYYYGKKLKEMMSVTDSKKPGTFVFRYNDEITFESIRGDMIIEDSQKDDGLLLDIMLDHYDDVDFRKIIIEEGTETEYNQGNKLSKRLGYGTLEEYKKAMSIKGKLDEAAEAYESLRIQKQAMNT